MPNSAEMSDVFVQESETGRATNEKGTLGGRDFTAVTSDEQEQRVTSGKHLRVIKDGGKGVDFKSLDAELTRLATNASAMKLVNVAETDRQVVEQLKRAHDNFEFVMERDTAAELKKEDDPADETAEAPALAA